MRIGINDLINAPLSNIYSYKELQLVLDNLPISERDKVLEIGCGIGLGSFIVSRVANEVIGIDISEPTIRFIKEKLLKRYSKRRNKLDFIVMDATRDPHQDWIEYFDKVFCIDVMEHIDVNLRDNLLDFAAKVVKRGGMFVITFPVNNYDHGYLITEEDVDHFAKKLKNLKFSVSIKRPVHISIKL